MEYFDLLPKEINEIIVSDLKYKDLLNLYTKAFSNINWSVVYFYRYGEYIKLEYESYILRLSVINLLKILRFNYTAKNLIKICALSLSFNDLKDVPEEIVNLPNLRTLYLHNNELSMLP